MYVKQLKVPHIKLKGLTNKKQSKTRKFGATADGLKIPESKN